MGAGWLAFHERTVSVRSQKLTKVPGMPRAQAMPRSPSEAGCFWKAISCMPPGDTRS